MERSYLVLAVGLVATLLGMGATWGEIEGATGGYVFVPSQYPTVQAAIDAVENGTTIIVAEGTYRENLLLNDRWLTLTSMNPLDPCVVANTILAPPQRGDGAVVTINDTGGGILTLSGFTITEGVYDGSGGSGWTVGGGVWAWYGTVCVEHCVIKDNRDEWGSNSAGIFFEATVGASVRQCVIADNAHEDQDDGYGWGIVLRDTVDTVISNCVITGHNAPVASAIYIRNLEADEPMFTLIENCTICENTCDFDGVVRCRDEWEETVVRNSIICRNSLDLTVSENSSVTYSLIERGGIYYDGYDLDVLSNLFQEF